MGDKWQKAKVGKYDVSSGTLVRNGEFCPRCGPGVFLANHSDRKTCGRCGYDASATSSNSTPPSQEEE
ncbi:MAG: 30S ribosomal protein S27ae [Euryarchaeota archaeon]|nr:30S ribosomal protein S27ae [Euryarchaeota archaeon]